MTDVHLEKLAQALADNLTQQLEVADVPDRYASWIDPDELAAAAIEALGLTEEWGVAYEGDSTPDDEPFDNFEEAQAEADTRCLSCDSCRNAIPKHVMSRLSSGWVAVTKGGEQ